MRIERIVRAVGIWTAAVFLPVALFAQSSTSTMTGIVKDSTGGAIPGAQVSVVNEDTSVAVDTVTNQEGIYRAGALVPGKYRVVVALDGFDTVTRTPLTLEVGQTLAIDVTL